MTKKDVRLSREEARILLGAALTELIKWTPYNIYWSMEQFDKKLQKIREYAEMGE